MNSELNSAITTVLIILLLFFIITIGAFVVFTLILFNVIQCGIILKIISFIGVILITIFFGIVIGETHEE